MVDKSTKVKKNKTPEEIVTVEEEDLFEDFPLSKEQSGLHPQGSGLGEKEKEAELPLWEADWDDEDVGGDFVQHLNAELAKKS